MSNPSPTACGLIWLRGLSDGETGGDAPRIDDDELCALYVTARGIGLQRSGRVIPVRVPMRFDVDACRSRPDQQVSGPDEFGPAAADHPAGTHPGTPAPDLPAVMCGGEVGEPSSEAL